MLDGSTEEVVPEPLRDPVRIGLLGLITLAAVLCGSTYWKYASLVDQKLRQGAFSGTSNIYSANPPTLITNVSRNREKRRMVRFEEIPKVLVDAVIAAEDKRFFRHQGLDPLRIMKAAYVDMRQGRKDQGASTLSMQLARSLLLAPDKSWKRKVAEIAMAVRLEQKLSKQQIFEYYCNQVYLGRRGTFNLRGFGAAAHAYFGKDVRDLTLPEAATLAGLIQRPSYYHPLRNPDRLRERRNLVLSLMQQTGSITASEYRQAVTTPLTIVPSSAQSTGAPYFLDLVNDELQNELGDRESRGEEQVYTTLDLNLQQAANDAVRIGMQVVDKQLQNQGAPAAQVALVALDPHTGEVKALVGGRNYLESQLNRALAQRQPGSAFKPFVYAEALSTVFRGGPEVVTPATFVIDEPTSFPSVGGPYEPENFGGRYSGKVTVRQALTQSINIPTVKLAEMAGYEQISDLAKRAGLGDHIEPTPSVALGSYEATPLEIAGAYTIFANHGVYVAPALITEVRNRDGQLNYSHTPDPRQVLDPRVAYLMVNLMEGVLASGTGTAVRKLGFTVPAAGKTGTSRDGWFVGFTSQLLCVVWVGFDDNRELNLEGSKSALPIWTEFMKRALQFPPYRNAKAFQPPPGVSSAKIDPGTGSLATPNCPSTRTEFFITGTEPRQKCALHGGITGMSEQSQ